MVRVNLQRTIVVYLAWLGFISAGLILVLSDLAPVLSSVVRPESLFTFLVYAELFFVLALWPLFIPKVLEEDRSAPPLPAEAGQVPVLLLQVVILFVFVLPLAFICQSISNLGLWEFFTGQLQVAVLASFVAALFSLAHERKWKIAPAYYLGFFVASAGLPFVYYLGVEFFGASLGFLSYASPFWAASSMNDALVQAGIFGAAAVGLLLGPAFLRKTASATA